MVRVQGGVVGRHAASAAQGMRGAMSAWPARCRHHCAAADAAFPQRCPIIITTTIIPTFRPIVRIGKLGGEVQPEVGVPLHLLVTKLDHLGAAAVSVREGDGRHYGDWVGGKRLKQPLPLACMLV